MRKPTFLSPSSKAKFFKNRTEFYLTYLAENRAPRMPQTLPMAVGSSFDAFSKSELYHRAFGANNPEYSFDALFEKQVEPHVRDEAYAAGMHVFECYLQSGAFENLDTLLRESAQPPQFEFQVEGVVGGVPLLGKPDCRFFHKSGAHIIFDWKVNGYCSKYSTSPAKYYARVLDGFAEHSKNHATPHKGYKPLVYNGVEINEGFLEETSEEWADQLATYGWLLDEPVGDEQYIAAVDQIVAKPTEARPVLRVAQFRSRISKAWQERLLKLYQECWTAIESGHIFTNKTREQNDFECEALERQATVLSGDSKYSKYLNEVTRARW